MKSPKEVKALGSELDPRFGCNVPGSDIGQVTRHAVLAEKSGFDVVSYPDHLFHPGRDDPPLDTYVVLASIGMNTSRVKIVPVVSDVLRRHPATIAHTFSTLDRLTNGRAMLGLGAGEFFNFETILDIANGDRWKKPVSALKEAVEVIKLLWSSTCEKPVSFDGEFFKLENAFLELKPICKPHPPIYIGGYGPRMKKLAIELADGWVPWLESPKTYRKALAEMKKYANDLGRSLSIDNALLVQTWVSKKVEEAREAVRSWVKGGLARRVRLLSALGHADLAQESIDLWHASAIDKEQLEKIRTAMQKIPPEALDEITIVGTPDEAISRIEEYLDAGVKLLIVVPPIMSSEGFEETVNAYKKVIIPYFRE